MARLLIVLLIFTFSVFSANAYTVMPAEKSSKITGYTRAVKSMNITAETAGRLVAVNYNMGDVVGEKTFAIIDPTFTKYSIRSVQTSIKKLSATIKRLENNITYQKKEFSRIESLYLSEVETESRRDGAKQSLDQSELSLAELMQDKAGLEVTLSELREKLDRQYIKIPTGWSTTSKPLEIGELVNVGQPIATAGDFRQLIVPVFVDNHQLKSLQSNKSIDVTIDGKAYEAVLNRINPAFDERTRKREVELLIDMTGIGGMYVEIPVKILADGFMVHEKTLISRYANPKVRIKQTGQSVRVNVLGKDGEMVLIGATPELKIGVELEAVTE